MPFEGAQYFTSTSGVTYAMQQALTPIPGQWFWWTTDGHWQGRHIDFGTQLLSFKGFGNTLYALLAPPNDGTTRYTLARSTNGGTTWDRSPLPIPFTPPSTKVVWSLTKTDADLAVNGQGVMVAGHAWFQAQPVADALQALRASRPGDPVLEQIGDDGDDITSCYVPNPRDSCVPKLVQRFSWSELGVQSQRAIYDQGVWLSSGAAHWQRVETDLDANSEWADTIGSEGSGLAALHDRFVMATHPYSNPTVSGDYTPTYYELVAGKWRRRALRPHHMDRLRRSHDRHGDVGTAAQSPGRALFLRCVRLSHLDGRGRHLAYDRRHAGRAEVDFGSFPASVQRTHRRWRGLHRHRDHAGGHEPVPARATGTNGSHRSVHDDR